MASEFKLMWSDAALNDLDKILKYLEDNWTE